ncbi:hypothetical protein D3C71_338940 [compost metagenome]
MVWHPIHGADMRSDISLEIHGTIKDASTFNAIIEDALEANEDARLAAADAGTGQYDDLRAVARHIESVAAEGNVLCLSLEDTRYEFANLRDALRAGGVGFRYTVHGERDYALSFRPGMKAEIEHDISLDDEPVLSFADVNKAHKEQGGIEKLLERAGIACFLPDGARIEVAPGVFEQWIREYASDPEADQTSEAGVTTWTR